MWSTNCSVTHPRSSPASLLLVSSYIQQLNLVSFIFSENISKLSSIQRKRGGGEGGGGIKENDLRRKRSKEYNNRKRKEQVPTGNSFAMVVWREKGNQKEKQEK